MQPFTGVLQSAVTEPALAPFISSLTYISGGIPGDNAPALERVLPGARIHLMVNLDEDEFRTYESGVVQRTSGAVLGGPGSRATVIDTHEQRHLVTVDFKLGGAAHFFKTPLSEARDQLVDLDKLWGLDGALLRERLLLAPSPEGKFRVLRSLLLRNLADAQAPDRAIPFAAAAFERGASVSDVTERLGLLPKTFVRRFRSGTGLSPEALCPGAPAAAPPGLDRRSRRGRLGEPCRQPRIRRSIPPDPRFSRIDRPDSSRLPAALS